MSTQPVIPYLTVRGAVEAIAFYQKAFGATETMRMAAEDGKRLMHAELSVNGGTLFLSDEFLEHDGAHGTGGRSQARRGRCARLDGAGRCRRDLQPGGERRRGRGHGAGGSILGRALCDADRSVRPPLDAQPAAAASVKAIRPPSSTNGPSRE